MRTVASAVGRVRSIFIGKIQTSWHKPAPTTYTDGFEFGIADSLSPIPYPLKPEVLNVKFYFS